MNNCSDVVWEALSAGAKGYVLKQMLELSFGPLSKQFFRTSNILVAVSKVAGRRKLDRLEATCFAECELSALGAELPPNSTIPSFRMLTGSMATGMSLV